MGHTEGLSLSMFCLLPIIIIINQYALVKNHTIIQMINLPRSQVILTFIICLWLTTEDIFKNDGEQTTLEPIDFDTIIVWTKNTFLKYHIQYYVFEYINIFLHFYEFKKFMAR